MKFKLILHKEFEMDTDRDWDGDISGLMVHLKDNTAPGDTAGPDEIHDAIREMLREDIESVVDLDLDDGDFEIEIPPGTKIEVPAEEGKED